MNGDVLDLMSSGKAYPLYHACVIRFALHGNWQTLFNVPSNALLLIKFLLPFLKYYSYGLFIVFCFGVMDIMLSITRFGILIISFLILNLYYVTKAHELDWIAKRA